MMWFKFIICKHSNFLFLLTNNYLTIFYNFKGFPNLFNLNIALIKLIILVKPLIIIVITMKKLFFLFLLLSIISCAKFSLYSEKIENFPDNRWLIAETKIFSFELTEDIEEAELKLFFSHVFQPGYDKIPVKVYVTKEGGEESIIKEELLLKSETGEDLGQCLGDICDLTQTIATQSLTKGKYTVKVMHEAKGPYLPNVIALGISLEATE